MIFSMPLMLAILIFIVKELVSNKLATNSGFSRLNDFYSGFMAWKDHPIFGAGYGDITSRLKYVSSFRLARAETGFTNSPFEVLDEGGIYLFLPFFMSFVFCLRYGLKKHNYEVICFLVGLTFIFVVCIFSRTFLILTFLAASHALFGIKKD